jgi:hypothetical protein
LLSPSDCRLWHWKRAWMWVVHIEKNEVKEWTNIRILGLCVCID